MHSRGFDLDSRVMKLARNLATALALAGLFASGACQKDSDKKKDPPGRPIVKDKPKDKKDEKPKDDKPKRGKKPDEY